MEVVAGQRVDIRSAAPVGAKPRAEAIVEIAKLRLHRVSRCPASRTGGIAVKIVELGTARRNPNLVDEGDRVGQRELNAAAIGAAARAAEEPAAAAAASTPAKSAAAASALRRRACNSRGRPGWRTGGTRRSALRAALATAAGETELRPQLVDHRLRRTPRLERVGEIEANA